MTVQYLIDSENVRDLWIPLLELPGQDTELIVFYTRNSPHMSYDSLIRLKESERTVTFIKCYEGTNALDFQLVSELGYRISKDEDGIFIIVTNDTGFDAAVKYWRRRKKSVKRITGKECRNLERRRREDLSAGSQETRSAAIADHSFTLPDQDTVQDTAADAGEFSPEAAQDQDARPSRPNLRDAERAAQPDPDDMIPETDPEDPEDADYADIDSEDADPFAFDPDDIEAEDTGYEAEQDELQDEPLYETESEDDPLFSDEDDEAAGFSEDVREEEQTDADDIQQESEPDFMTEHRDSQEVPAEQDLPHTPEEDAEQASVPAAEQDNESENAAEISISDASAGTDAADSGLLREADAVVNEEVHADAAVNEAAQAYTAVNAAVHADAAVNEAVHADAAPNEKAEADVTAAAEEKTSAEEEPAAETAHRSKSRRSRSRKSKSASRKQEQAAAAAESDDSADAAEGAKTGEASDTSKASGAEDSKSRKNDTGRNVPDEAGESASDALPAPGDEEIAKIVACIGAENLAELHNQLATFYGEQGKDIYLSIKNNTRSLSVLKPDLKQKFAYYCEIIFYRSGYAGEYPSDISEYLLNVREKLNNLNSLRYALQKHYGKEKGRRFYFLLKPFAKTMYQM